MAEVAKTEQPKPPLDSPRADQRQQGAMGGIGGLLGGGKQKRVDPETVRVTFDDVAGIDEVEGEINEVVDYLRDPAKYQRLGARAPKGVLLTGAPGTGKTLLARATAGEAKVPSSARAPRSSSR